ncbi:MAG: glycosyltransferase [Paramuribaculum sp.]|nr:glycosyltransferase [Paramuribaculum sp.]
MNVVSLSLIIPVYNASKYLEACLDSVLKELHPGWEIILIDDGSTDDSLAICKRYADIYPELKIIQKDNGGVSSARNAGIGKALGRYVFFIDSDDCLAPGFGMIIEKCIQKDLDLVFFRRRYLHRNCDEYDFTNLKKDFEKIDENLYQVLDAEKALLSKMFCSGSGEILLKRSLISNLRFDATRAILEDMDFFLKVMNNHPDVYFADVVSLIINDEVPGSLTKKRISVEHKKMVAETNPYLSDKQCLRKRLYWLEIYFDLKRLKFTGRFKYISLNRCFSFKNISFNKYFVGSIFLLLNTDINQLRKRITKLKSHGDEK